MRLKIVLPTQILLDRTVEKVIAEGAEGSFCVLPKHVNFITALVPGILYFVAEANAEQFVAVDEGLFVKQEDEVLVSTRHAVIGPELAVLKRHVEREYLVLDEHERHTRSELAKLEAHFVKRFIEHQKV